MTEEVIVYEPGEGDDRPLVEQINQTLNRELKSPDTVRALLATTFKGLDVVKMKQALMEGMIRGFSFKDFLQKDIYAIPFASGYSLITSIEHARKRGMRAGIVGKGAPVYTFKEDKSIESCSVTVKRIVNGYVGDFTQTVDFDEYTTKKNLWVSKPKTMIAKVAEMHALRMACPEDLAHLYVEEEFDSETAKTSRMKEAKEAGSSLQMKNLLKDDNKEKGSKAGEDQTQTETTDSNEIDNEQPPD